MEQKIQERNINTVFTKTRTTVTRIAIRDDT